MDIHSILILVAAGVAGGAISALVGGASMVVFPTLLAAGLPPVSAVVVGTIALTPSNFFAALYDRSQLPPLDKSFIALILSSVLGGAVGAALLLSTSERIFEVMVPLLLGFATILFAYAGRISEWMRKRALARGRKVQSRGAVLGMLVPVSVYGGYFGAGVGVLLLGVLSIGTKGDYRSANVTKNLVGSLNSLVASMVFIVNESVPWWPAVAVTAGALAGGLIGARLAQIIPHAVMRVVVVAVGVLLTAAFTKRYWF